MTGPIEDMTVAEPFGYKDERMDFPPMNNNQDMISFREILFIQGRRSAVMKKMLVSSLGFAVCFVGVWTGGAQVYTILHDFAGALSAPADGVSPYGSLASKDATLYGMTFAGGANGAGVIFSMSTDGSGYNILHNFPDPAVPNDGATPWNSLLLEGDTLYGMTLGGGSSGNGTVFSIDTNGSNYGILHNFLDGTVPNDGITPFGNVISDSGTLYGMTLTGGANGAGTIFSMSTDGSNYNILHSFPDPAVTNDGTTPWDSLTLENNKLYGMTLAGGSNAAGTAFSMSTDGSNYNVLHNFPDPAFPDDGVTPYGNLISDGSSLYGMAHAGGSGWAGNYNYGIIFSMNTDGSAYTHLHNFTIGPHEGALPFGSLLSDDSTLYGMTSNGGAYGLLPGYGTIFSMGTDGAGFELLHSFAGPPDDGRLPWGNVISDGSALYGMTLSGGEHDYGVIFSYALPTPTPTPIPLINLNVNKTTFSTTDRIAVTADLLATSTSFQPYISIDMPNGQTLYYVRGEGFTGVPAPYLSNGPFVLPNAITNYRVLDVPFAGVPVGGYTLNGWGNDVFGNVIDFVDQEQLTVN
jgi:uncharacterized repeat protein (TIGR03803 family)